MIELRSKFAKYLICFLLIMVSGCANTVIDRYDFEDNYFGPVIVLYPNPTIGSESRYKSHDSVVYIVQGGISMTDTDFMDYTTNFRNMKLKFGDESKIPIYIVNSNENIELADTNKFVLVFNQQSGNISFPFKNKSINFHSFIILPFNVDDRGHYLRRNEAIWDSLMQCF